MSVCAPSVSELTEKAYGPPDLLSIMVPSTYSSTRAALEVAETVKSGGTVAPFDGDAIETLAEPPPPPDAAPTRVSSICTESCPVPHSPRRPQARSVCSPQLTV